MTANRLSDWSRVHAVVTGLGVSGYSVADGLPSLGARVTVLDESNTHVDKTAILGALDAMVRLEKGATAELPGDTDPVVIPSGWRSDTPLLIRTLERGIPAWGDIELVWRMQQSDRAIPRLGVTGTDGKTTTIQMAESMLRAAEMCAAVVGNIGCSIVEVILDDEPYDAPVVELPSSQLHWVYTVALHFAVVLNLHGNHLEFYNGPGGYERCVAGKARIFERVMNVCAYNVVEPETERFVEEAEVTERARVIGFTTGISTISMIGVVDGLIVDRVFVAQRHSSVLELAKVADVRPYAPHNVANTCTAAALVRSLGVPARSMARGFRDLRLAGYRIAEVAETNGVRWIGDLEATNSYTVDSVMWAPPSFVWVADGQIRGTSLDEPITTHRDRIRAAILIGVDRRVIADTLSRHAPDVPAIILGSSDHGVVDEAVSHAARPAREGDAVSLSPGSASLDMLTGYDDRGERFADAVRSLQAPNSQAHQWPKRPLPDVRPATWYGR